MGCNNSKSTVKKSEEQAGKTLLTAEATAAEPVKDAEPAVEAAKEAETAKETELLTDAPKEADTAEPAAPQSEPVLAALKVSILSARGLRNADWVGKSDPYCTCEVTGKADTRIETATVDDQLNPAWNHDGEISGFCVGDSLTFLVKDKDPLKPDDALGKLVLESSTLFPNGFDGEIPLTEAGTGIEAFLKVQVVVVHPKVRVTINSAKGLRNADWIGKSDPYCICEVEGKQDVKMLTASVDDNLNPQWNYQAELAGYQILDTLSFTVKDKDPLKPDDVLGSASLPYESFKNGFDGEIQLTQTPEGITSTLQLKVEIGDNTEQVVTQVEEKSQCVTEVATLAVVEPIAQACSDEPTITAETAPRKALSCWC